MELTRRKFLLSSAAASLLLSLDRLGFAQVTQSGAGAAAAPPIPPYRTWEDVFRQQWTWDRVVHCTHNRANCMSACAWNVYVKDGMVWREEQAHVYDEGGRAGTPDFFPRGCQKGACYSKLMHTPQRLRYPLERVGARGSGQWKRISWDEAFDKIADGIIKAATEHGAETVIATPGPNFDHGPDSAAEFRFSRVLGVTTLDTFSGIGDMPVGMIQTYGMFMNDGTADDYFNSDYIVLWSANPLYTRIPDMHFITEARYRGAHVVVIGPDYNATAIHADRWLNPKVQSDPALALALAQVLISEQLCKDDYIKEQTDLPFLVRTDTGRFLRERDLIKGGRDNVFYIWDEAQGAAVLAPGSQGMRKPTLVLGDIRPALQGRHAVKLADGTRVEAEPLFELLRRQLNAGYTPELAEQITGVHAEVIRSTARELAAARAALIYASTGACKHYHSDLMHRSFALLMALTGNQGKPGGGLRLGAWWGLNGFDELGSGEVASWMKLALRITGRPAVRDVETYMIERARALAFSPVLPWLQVHGGYAPTMGSAGNNDSGNPLGMDAAMKTAVEQRWMPIFPAPGKSPKVFVVNADNPLRQWPSPQIALEHLWPKFDLVVNVNTQMSTTGMHSDIVLPAAGWYEKIGIKYAWCFLPYLVLGDKAVEPLGESRNEWWIFGSLCRRIQERARARGVTKVKNAFGKDLDFAQVFETWSDGGTFDPAEPRTGMDYIFQRSEICAGTTWDEAIKRGVVPIERNGPYNMFNNMCTDVDFTRPLYPNAWQIEEKESWPTLTGRQQFYLDHDWYVAAGEALPVHKAPPAAGGQYPLRMTGGHTRWSIHTIWRSEATMLRLQRGQPVLYMNKDDALARQLGDHDRVRIFNDLGAFECVVKVTPAAQPGQVIIYHAWENFQFPRHQGQQEPITGSWKSLHLVGDYGQLHYRALYGAPNFGPRGVAVEVQKL
ncbi:MAG: molybdopterin-dependent oxidoreductase [Deltaproteobacteria bacterium]|nr:molybdopterin-dependent oxidoreductase [Deltaproteobacteria bacterium]